jgi:hypothetical protein
MFLPEWNELGAKAEPDDCDIEFTGAHRLGGDWVKLEF